MERLVSVGHTWGPRRLPFWADTWFFTFLPFYLKALSVCSKRLDSESAAVLPFGHFQSSLSTSAFRTGVGNSGAF